MCNAMDFNSLTFVRKKKITLENAFEVDLIELKAFFLVLKSFPLKLIYIDKSIYIKRG